MPLLIHAGIIKLVYVNKRSRRPKLDNHRQIEATQFFNIRIPFNEPFQRSTAWCFSFIWIQRKCLWPLQIHTAQLNPLPWICGYSSKYEVLQVVVSGKWLFFNCHNVWYLKIPYKYCYKFKCVTVEYETVSYKPSLSMVMTYLLIFSNFINEVKFWNIYIYIWFIVESTSAQVN